MPIATVAVLRRDALLPRSLPRSTRIIIRELLLAQRDEGIEMVAEVVEGGQQAEHITVGWCCWHFTELDGTMQCDDDNAVMTMRRESVETLDLCSDSNVGVDNAVITLLCNCTNVARPVIRSNANPK
jgi:hypothetical protein